MIMNRDNKPSTFLNDSERMLSTVGPLSMLPMLLACLGSVLPLPVSAMSSLTSSATSSPTATSTPVSSCTPSA